MAKEWPYSSARETAERNITLASKVIDSLDDVPAEFTRRGIVLHCRESGETQVRNGNLRNQVDDALVRLEARRLKVVKVFQGQESSSIFAFRNLLLDAMRYAGSGGLLIVAPTRDRFLRRHGFGPGIPLPDATIKALHAHAAANKTFQRGTVVHKYLFGRLIFCAHCGNVMSGQTNHGGRRYYRHASRIECKKPGEKAWVNAEVLDEVIIRHLFELFGNPVAVQKAIDEATPNRGKIAELQERLQRVEEGLAKTRAGRERVLGLVFKGTIAEAAAEGQLETINQKEARQIAEQNKLQAELAHVPDRKAVEALSQRVAERFGTHNYSSASEVAKRSQINSQFGRMTWKEKRALAEMVFSGKRPDGSRMGVYISWINGQEARRRKQWNYEIHGHLVQEDGHVPMTKAEAAELFSFGGERQMQLETRVQISPES